jgi:hypothetical protein
LEKNRKKEENQKGKKQNKKSENEIKGKVFSHPHLFAVLVSRL